MLVYEVIRLTQWEINMVTVLLWYSISCGSASEIRFSVLV